MFLFIIAIEILLLFLVSKRFIQLLSFTLFRLTKNKTLTVMILWAIFLPGTIIHELGHMLVASILFVRVGEVEFVPKLEGDRIKMGSVAVEQTDPIRRSIIGVAPVILGIFIFLIASTYLVPILTIDARALLILTLILIVYFLFSVGNTMFSSKKDMEGTLALVATLAVIVIVLYFVGLRFDTQNIRNVLGFIESNYTENLKNVAIFLSIPVIVDTALLLLLQLINRESLKSWQVDSG